MFKYYINDELYIEAKTLEELNLILKSKNIILELTKLIEIEDEQIQNELDKEIENIINEEEQMFEDALNEESDMFIEEENKQIEKLTEIKNKKLIN